MMPILACLISFLLACGLVNLLGETQPPVGTRHGAFGTHRIPAAGSHRPNSKAGNYLRLTAAFND
jgi:hypothetical protein